MELHCWHEGIVISSQSQSAQASHQTLCFAALLLQAPRTATRSLLRRVEGMLTPAHLERFSQATIGLVT